MKQYKNIILFLYIFFIPIQCFNVERVILATDLNKDFIEFWPHVADWWRIIVGVKNVTLALIGKNCSVDSHDADIIFLEPIPGIPTSLYAQTIRLLLPILYPDEVCILADMDMVPLSKNFFIDATQDISDDSFLVYHTYATHPTFYPEARHRLPMLHVAAKGYIFSEIFNVYTKEQFFQKIIEWKNLNLGYSTDERILYKCVHDWNKFKTNVVIRDPKDFYNHRLGRELNFDKTLLKNFYYYDAHCPRPYSTHKKKINHLVDLILTYSYGI